MRVGARERRVAAATRGLDTRARWVASDPAGLDWPVPWTPGYSCEGCGAEPVLVILLRFGPEAGRRLCAMCAPPPAPGAP